MGNENHVAREQRRAVVIAGTAVLLLVYLGYTAVWETSTPTRQVPVISHPEPLQPPSGVTGTPRYARHTKRPPLNDDNSGYDQSAAPSGVAQPLPRQFQTTPGASNLNDVTKAPVQPHVEVAPQLIFSPLPEYPPAALRAGIEGEVTIMFSIFADGTVGDVRVVQSSPPGWFEDTAIRAIEARRYRPRSVDGMPVETVNQQVVLTFKIRR